MLRRHIGVAQLLGQRVRGLQDPVQLPGGSRRAAAALGRKPVQLPVRLGPQLTDVEPGLLEHRHDDPLLLVQ